MKFPSFKRSPSSSPPSSSPPSPGGGAAAASCSTSPTSPSKKIFSLSGRSRSKKLDSPPPDISETPSSSNSSPFSSSSSPPHSHPHGKSKSSSTAPDHPSVSSSPRSSPHAGKAKASSSYSDQPSASLSVRGGKGDTAENSMAEIQQVFAQFDTNGDGKISSEELRAVLALLGDETTSEEAALMVREVDIDGKGYLNLEEFVQLNERCLHGATEEEEMKAVFEIFDIDKNGWISAEELQAVLRRLGGGLAQRTSVEDCKRMIRGVDQKGVGHVDFDDFMRMMTPLTS